MTPRRISRRAFGTAAVFAAAAVAAPVLRAQAPRPEKARVSVVVSNRAAFSVLPLCVAEQLGFFRAEGLDLEVSDRVSRPADDVAPGAADIVGGGFENVVQLQGRGHAFQAFVVQARAPQVAVGVSTRAFPAWRGMADLRGRRIGVSSAGSMTHLVASLVLARGGLRAGDAHMVPVGTSQEALVALRAGQVDAISSVDPVMTYLEQRGEIRLVADTRTIKGVQDVFGGVMPGGCLYAPSEFVQKHPLTCQAVSNGIVRSLKWLQTAGPSDIIKTVPEWYFGGDRALYLAAFTKVRETISPDGLFADDCVRTAVRAIAGFDAGFRADVVQSARVYTNDLARRSKEKFHA